MTAHLCPRSLSAFIALLLAAPLGAQASFTPLSELPGGQDRSWANDVVSDGSLVVGASSVDVVAAEAFAWTEATGIVALGTLPASNPGSWANGVDLDGSVFVGTSRTHPHPSSVAVRWTSAGLESLGFLPGGGTHSVANACDADGSVIVGAASSPAGGLRAVRWVNGAIEELGPMIPGHAVSAANDVSDDGSVVVGKSAVEFFSSVNDVAARWTPEHGFQAISSLPGAPFNAHEASGVSGDGDVIVGWMSYGNETHAWRYTASTATTDWIGDLPGGFVLGQAWGVSDDGEVVVGRGHTENGWEAFVWTREGGLRKVRDVLVERGLASELEGWLLEDAKAASADGSVIVGAGTNPDGDREAYRAVIPGPSPLVARQHRIAEGTGGFTGFLEPGNGFGAALARIDDLDGDFVPELAVGMEHQSSTTSDGGRVRILFLDVSGRVKFHTEIGEGLGAFPGAIHPGDRFGASLASLGDIDGDGVGDIAVGAPGDDAGDGEFADYGAVWVLLLNADGTVKSLALNDEDSGLGIQAKDNFGWRIGTLGDLDGNGKVEIGVSYFRKTSPGGGMRIFQVEPDGTLSYYGEVTPGAIGSVGTMPMGIAGGFDFDSDGDTDLVLGSSGLISSGAAWAVPMQGTVVVPKSTETIVAAPGHPVIPIQFGDLFGAAIANVGDLDGNGTNDLLVGAPGTSAAEPNDGAAWLVYLEGPNGAARAARRISASDGGFGGALGSLSRFGDAVEVLGDLDFDGTLEVAIGETERTSDGEGGVWIVSLDCVMPASATSRTAGNNPQSLTSGLPLLGEPVHLEVDLAGTTGHSLALMLGFVAPGLTHVFNGQFLLVDTSHPAGNLLSGPFQSGPVAEFDFEIPPLVDFCGATLSVQAVHLSGGPIAFSNAIDWVVGI